MKKLFPYIMLLLFVFATSCDSDDKVSYETIPKENKERLIGEWELVFLSSFMEENYPFEQREEVFYQFTVDGKLIIKNTLSVQAENGELYEFFVNSDTLSYTFEYNERYDFERSNKEKLKIFNEKQKYYFSMNIISDTEIGFSQFDGYAFRLENTKDYTNISYETRELLVGKWRLLKIADFSGRTREFGEEEEVYYEFTKDGKVIVQNISTLSDEIFDTFLISRTFKYCYKYDPHWVEGEVMIMEYGGDFSIGVSEERLVLAQYDGYGVWFERAE
jgi:hypothetical protein